MKILVVQESNWIERNPHQQHHLMERLSLRNHEIRVIDYDINWRDTRNQGLISKRIVFKNVHKIHDQASVQVIRPGFIKIPVLNYLSWAWTNWKEINHQVKEFKPDVIIGFGLINTHIAAGIAKKHNIPFVYYLIDVLFNLIPEKSLQLIGKQINKGVMKNSDTIITINKKLSEAAVSLGACSDRTMVIDAGIDQEKFNPQIDGSLIREKYGVKDDELLLFFMGWIYQFAGVKEVAEELGKGQYEKIKLMVVGDGDAYPDLEKIKSKYDLGEKLILTGKKPYDQIPELIAAADICILPAHPDEIIMQDIVPIKVYEYMAMAKPVITTNLPGIRVEFGEDNGIIYTEKSDNILDVANQINPREIGQKALNLVRNNDWNKITDKFEDVLKLSSK
ncbi:glycosyltransferase family 4 protein [uncultured Methanobacterium sp.]|uniref:glycosyltransferase family 4 protein n=1 Tax=uncultured Methanobacterium sp. TaxID=176306 RepID=UPI002AA63B51|nr:glycosyltransferase family 4 protein [uncultured Methanobacterium sp.]